MYLRKAIFALLVFSGFLLAANNDLGFLVPITAIMVAIFLALMYMLSQSFSAPALEAWAKTELRELIAGVILVVVVYTILFSANNITSVLTGTSDYIKGAETIISKIEQGYDNAYYDIIRAGTKLRVAATYSTWFTVSAWFFAAVYSTSPVGGIAPLFAPLTTATQGFSNNLLIYEGILLLIKLSRVSVQLVLLPLAFCIRMVPFTRKTGNTLIAVCIGAMVFLPFSVYLVDFVHGIIKYPAPKLSTTQLEDLDFVSSKGGGWVLGIAEPFCKIQFIRFMLSLTEYGFPLLVCSWLLAIPVSGPALFSACYTLFSQVLFNLFVTIFRVINTLALIAFIASGEGSGYALNAYDAIYPFLRDVNNLILMGYLDIVLIGLMTIGGIRSVSAALGGEWYLAGIQRLV